MPGGETTGLSRAIETTMEEITLGPAVTINTQIMTRINTGMTGGTVPGMAAPGKTGERHGVMTIVVGVVAPGMDLARP